MTISADAVRVSADTEQTNHSFMISQNYNKASVNSFSHLTARN